MMDLSGHVTIYGPSDRWKPLETKTYCPQPPAIIHALEDVAGSGTGRGVTCQLMVKDVMQYFLDQMFAKLTRRNNLRRDI